MVIAREQRAHCSVWRRSTQTPVAAITDPRASLATLSARDVDYIVGARYAADR
jgi:hypothetical protein